jgi:serine/threonine protein phosphatase 1
VGVHLKDAKGPAGMCIYAIGDVHGRLDLLAKMHEGIADHLKQRAADDWRIIHLGDYTDRGPGSRGVLEFLIAASERDPRIICLAGNHDVGFLDFLVGPDTNGLFANNGGRQTAQSYGVDLNFMDPVNFRSQYEAFRHAVPEAHRTFLQNLRFSIEFGDFFFCHAGVMPGVPLADQEPRDLIWIRDRFLNHAELYAKVIVHGHTPAPQPEVLANRVNVDTGAYASGVLTALVIEGDDKQLMQVVGG